MLPWKKSWKQNKMTTFLDNRCNLNFLSTLSYLNVKRDGADFLVGKEEKEGQSNVRNESTNSHQSQNLVGQVVGVPCQTRGNLAGQEVRLQS